MTAGTRTSIGGEAEAIAKDLAAVGALQAVPTLLEVLCDISGLGLAAIARVTATTWTVCAVKDRINCNLVPGAQFELAGSPSRLAGAGQSAVIVSCAGEGPQHQDYLLPRALNAESYVSVPIALADGRPFGSLCAMDTKPAELTDPKIKSIFERFAALLAHLLDSELKREETEAALRNERETGELREQFIAILGHDLRNPLQALTTTSLLIRKKAADPLIQEMALRISKNAQRMAALINDILDFARGRLGGGIGLVVEQTADVGVALAEVVTEFKDGHPEREVNADIRVTRTVRCDIARLQQLVSNLIANALSHGSPDRPVNVRAVTDEAELIVEVANEGEPIAQKVLPKVFEPFWRHSTNRDRQGLGLGLSICSQIVRAHNGSISVISTKDAGTIFTARIPLR